MAETPERIAEGVYRVDAIPLSNAVNVLLVEDGGGWTLVDTGIGGSVGRIKNAFAALGYGAESLKRIFLTHQHDDHVGGLKGVLEWAPKAEVCASEHEAEVISGKRGFDPSSNPIMRRLASNAEPPGVPVDRTVREGDVVAGFRVISTPAPGRRSQGVLHRSGGGQALGGEVVGGGFQDRGARPRKADPGAKELHRAAVARCDYV